MHKNNHQIHYSRVTLGVYVGICNLLRDESVWKLFQDISNSVEGKDVFSKALFTQTGILTYVKNNTTIMTQFLNRAFMTFQKIPGNVVKNMQEQVKLFDGIENECLKVVKYIVSCGINEYQNNPVYQNLINEMRNVCLL